MHLALLSGGTGWHVADLRRAAVELGHTAQPLDFRTLLAGAPGRSSFDGFDAVIVRTMPAGSLEQIIFRMDALHGAVQAGVKVLNPPRALEACVDKYLTNLRLLAAGLPVPRTVVCQRADDAMIAFANLGSEVVVKPLFGSEGRGMVRVSDPELAWRTFKAIEHTGGVLYLQQFIRHPGWDVRAFVIGGRVIAAMKRSARGDWRTNVAVGGTAERFELAVAEQKLAVEAAAAVGAAVAGVDLLPGPGGEWFVIEVNAVPGWRALAAASGKDIAVAVVRFLAEEYR
jgi:ribosomal protein S6--L-glutamate ligase